MARFYFCLFSLWISRSKWFTDWERELGTSTKRLEKKRWRRHDLMLFLKKKYLVLSRQWWWWWWCFAPQIMKAFWFEEKSSGPRKKMTFSFFSFNCLLKREKNAVHSWWRGFWSISPIYWLQLIFRKSRGTSDLLIWNTWKLIKTEQPFLLVFRNNDKVITELNQYLFVGLMPN